MVKCQCRTVKGTRCSRNARPKQKYCGTHLKKCKQTVVVRKPSSSGGKKKVVKRAKAAKKCPAGKIFNAKTGRCVNRDGKIGKQLIARAKVHQRELDKKMATHHPKRWARARKRLMAEAGVRSRPTDHNGALYKRYKDREIDWIPPEMIPHLAAVERSLIQQGMDIIPRFQIS